VTAAQKIRKRLARDTVLMPGVFDALGARIACDTGFEVIFISGYSVSAVTLAEPDFGYISLPDVVSAAGRVCAVADPAGVPVIVDADTGYGNALNVAHTVGQLQRAGAAGMFLEDQVWPKKCGHMRGKQVIPAAEQAGKIRAAAAARGKQDFFIVARTDARQVNGLKDAIKRCLLYKQAGADALFVEAPQSLGELKTIARELPPPLVANMLERGVTPQLTRAELRAIGFHMIVCPLSVLFAYATAAREVLTALRRDGSTYGQLDKLMGFDEFNRLMRLESKYEAERRYAG
jgi:2-methylisocitrate lyase-like PEP mutase family enzyme